MNKSTKFLIALLLIAVIFLSIAAGCFDRFQETPPPGPARRGAGFGDRNREQGGFLLCYLREAGE